MCIFWHLGDVAVSLLEELPDDETVRSGSISSDVVLGCRYFRYQRGRRVLDLLEIVFLRFKVEFYSFFLYHFFILVTKSSNIKK